MENFKREELITLYVAASDEMRKSADTHQARLGAFATVSATYIAALTAGFFNSSSKSHYLAVASGSIIFIFLADYIKTSMKGIYMAYTINQTVRAKYEQLLGLTQPIKGLPENSYWNGEAIVHPLTLALRTAFPSSTDYLTDRLQNGGDQVGSRRLFTGFQLIALLLAFISGFRIF